MKQFTYKGTEERIAEQKRINSRNTKVSAGLAALQSSLIRTNGSIAARSGKSIFDCPYEADSSESEVWFDGFQGLSK